MRGCLEHGIAAVSVCLGVCLCHGGEPAKPNPASIVRPADSVAPEPRDREEYLLTIEEVEGGSPKLARPQGAALRDSGWLETADGASHQLRVNKRIEVLISPVSPFHLKVNDRGEVVELNGRLRKSDPKIISHARRLSDRGRVPDGASGRGQDGDELFHTDQPRKKVVDERSDRLPRPDLEPGKAPPGQRPAAD